MPTCLLSLGSRVTSLPSTRTLPLDGWMKPAKVRNAVVFPQPEGPSRVKNSPGRTCRSRCGMAVKSPKETSMLSKRIMANLSVERAGETGGMAGWHENPLRHVLEFDLLHPGAHVLL